VLERDGYRCQAPGCTGFGKEGHHIKFICFKGPDEEWNVVAVCVACHKLIHKHKTLKVYGVAPDKLVWERPYERWVDGRRTLLSPPALGPP
jgi:hypothetical protein